LKTLDLKEKRAINQKSTIRDQKYNVLTIGRIRGVHGLKGTLKVESFADSPDTFKPGRKIFLKNQGMDGVQYSTYFIQKVSGHRQGILLNLEGIENRSLAEELVGNDILIDRASLPEPEEDAWYWHDLIGLDVEDHIKGYIGKIISIFPTGANDVLVIRDNKKEILVPMHKNFVESVDMEKGSILTTLPESWIMAEKKETKMDRSDSQ
jgi:16S rRNA processing protein RimM